MGDEIKQPDNIGRVLPVNPARDTGPRNRPRQPPAPDKRRKRRQPPPDDQVHRVDEYV
ncbi:MAG: hypothetical protein WBR56_21255 [Sedimenticolaceae bacterium]